MPDLPERHHESPCDGTPAAADGPCVTPDGTDIRRDTWDALEHDVVTCRACSRLVAWREEVAATKRRAFRNWTYWGMPVPGSCLPGIAPARHSTPPCTAPASPTKQHGSRPTTD